LLALWQSVAVVIQHSSFTAQAAVLARTAVFVGKNILSNCAMPTRNFTTIVKPCAMPDSCLPYYSPSTHAVTYNSIFAAAPVSAPYLSLDFKPPKKPWARFPRVTSASPHRFNLSAINCELLDARFLKSKSLFICDDLL